MYLPFYLPRLGPELPHINQLLCEYPAWNGAEAGEDCEISRRGRPIWGCSGCLWLSQWSSGLIDAAVSKEAVEKIGSEADMPLVNMWEHKQPWQGSHELLSRPRAGCMKHPGVVRDMLSRLVGRSSLVRQTYLGWEADWEEEGPEAVIVIVDGHKGYSN